MKSKKSSPLLEPETLMPTLSSGTGVSAEFDYNVDIDKSHIIYLSGVVFVVALILRWFNESRRRAREEQRQPLLGAGSSPGIKSDSRILRVLAMNNVNSNDAAEYWTVRCAPGGVLCDVNETFIVIVTGTYDVTLRFEGSISSGNCDIARLSVKDNVEDTNIMVAQLAVVDGIQALEISAKESNLDVVLLQKERVVQVMNQGSGDVGVLEGVFRTSGPVLVFTNIDRGNIFINSSTSITVDNLHLLSQASGHIQASFSTLNVTTVFLNACSSGTVTVLVGSNATAETLKLNIEGSGALCFTAGSSILTNRIKIEKIGTGNISLGPRGLCQQAGMVTSGSGTIDIGGVQCQNVNVDLYGSGNVIVQATNTLSGYVYGSGHVKYFDNAPHSIDNRNYIGLVTAIPVPKSYRPAQCKVTPFPLFPKASSDTAVTQKSIGKGFLYDVDFVQNNVLYVGGVVFLVGLILRWFNESRRRTREEQSQPLLPAERVRTTN